MFFLWCASEEVSTKFGYLQFTYFCLCPKRLEGDDGSKGNRSKPIYILHTSRHWVRGHMHLIKMGLDEMYFKILFNTKYSLDKKRKKKVLLSDYAVKPLFNILKYLSSFFYPKWYSTRQIILCLSSSTQLAFYISILGV